MNDTNRSLAYRSWRIGVVLFLTLMPIVLQRPAMAAALTPLTLRANSASGQPVGSTIIWTAAIIDESTPEYRFSVGLVGQPQTITRDFATGESFSWTPLAEGTYQVQVVARESGVVGATESSTATNFTITSRVTANQPVLSATAHPLVALYSLPPCGTGTVQVLFGHDQAAQDTQRTPRVACSPTTSTNLYLVGMLPSTTYAIQAIYIDSTTTRYGPTATWTTGALPSDIAFPDTSTPLPATADTSLGDGIVWRTTVGDGMGSTRTQLYATNLAGQIVWYMPSSTYVQAGVARPLPGGNILAVVNDGPNEIVRISDPAGNPVRETSTTRINEQLATLPSTPGHTVETVRALHHELNLLPNGHIVFFGYTERLFPNGTQGEDTGESVDIVGDEIIDLDPNLQVAWTWNAFDHLDVGRKASLSELCSGGGCSVPLQYIGQSGGVAQDWLHSNAISYSPNDHNLLVSIRHQDWIVKIDYRDAQGDGHIVWKLGQEGDFTLTNPSPDDNFPWFSHQHGIEMTADGRLLTFDNGDLRCEGAEAECHSRGQVYQLDEQNHQATLILDVDMGNYSAALGWAQLLQNGNYAFTSGYQQQSPPPLGEVEEFNPAGQPVYTLRAQPELLYRGYRLSTMYDGCCSPLAAIPPQPSSVNFNDVSPADPAYAAITKLARRGIIQGYGDGRFGPEDQTLRAQMAALIARAMSWNNEDHGNPFPDQGSVDPDLWRNVGTLAFYNVARGYEDGTFGPDNAVLNVQVISLITRALVANGHWQQQPDDPALYPNVLASSGHREDLATFVHYAGVIPGTTANADWAAWDQPATRSWFAILLWQALATTN